MGPAHAGKATEQVNMVEKGCAETRRRSWVVHRDPAQQILQIS